MLDIELDAFGRRLGLPSLELGEAGIASLVIDGLGTLSLQTGEGASEDELLMTLAVPLEPSTAAERYAAALERCGWRSGLPLPLSASLFRDHLILTVRFPADRVTAPQLENALRFISDEAARLAA